MQLDTNLVSLTLKRLILICFSIFLAACSSEDIPSKIEPVTDFELQRYLGQWYEVARIENRFEKGLFRVTANYSLNEQGDVLVLNKGMSDNGEWKEARGIAKFINSDSTGHLKVSFFRPFYGGYIVFYLDEDYQTAFVTSNTKEYLWLLSREKTVSDCMKITFEDTAKELGFDLTELVYVAQ